ncbi:hypothetical protein OUZ56_003223 [Daphnia magna]|uniref:Uncharacterized protein n=1 Tax=Daphnia magna TaxID=35525 RepID=A0ABR0A845_9CRUS|nr:hypothetical protein OUZ56_003223 [Daphnia magna]
MRQNTRCFRGRALLREAGRVAAAGRCLEDPLPPPRVNRPSPMPHHPLLRSLQGPCKKETSLECVPAPRWEEGKAEWTGVKAEFRGRLHFSLSFSRHHNLFPLAGIGRTVGRHDGAELVAKGNLSR